MNKVIIFSAPSGSGKTTIVKYLLPHFPQLAFSISATSRAPRGQEIDGVDYFFLSAQQFAEAVAEDQFVEYQEVYPGTCYGTLRREMERIWNNNGVVVFDVDVVGGVNLKRLFGQKALAIFIMPPSVEVLGQRLLARATDDRQAIERRLAKAEHEISFAPQFDAVVVNDNLEKAQQEARQMIDKFLQDDK
ncbi:MAG: guanylate kinase [Mucinivorans sp.]